MRLPGWMLFVAGAVVAGFSIASRNSKLVLFVWIGLTVAIYGLIRWILDFLSAQRERKAGMQPQHYMHQQGQHMQGPHHHPVQNPQRLMHQGSAEYIQPIRNPQAQHQYMMRQHQMTHPVHHDYKPQQRLCACGANLNPSDNFCYACGRRVR